ncbi:helix-turn-helix domain-containing protein [Allorhodopirellula heiligendammensis]|uniref:Transcriptional regulatory protein ZraR n=1 Tax=Allorhodopirellula heiligendammensis TaxID=2714739 RepID=A0A5C6BEW8_9BACT|nr:helix-turn-helix domain-containing protein [Allorhodopirellula heiligendammensis]TWU10725.1 Transcriptional regulatory protein ZraR [Allorhodopirellula heiligendammensis]
MRSWLRVGEDLPDAIASLLTIDRAMFTIGGRFRGHLTRRLHRPRASDGGPDSEHRTAMAHFVVLGSCPATPAPDAERSHLILGCLGDFIADTEIPWEDWFGDRGVREAAKLDEELARFRDHHQRRAQLILAGTSSPARRLRARVELACRIRCHVGLVGPAGCGAAEIAALIHHTSAPGEPWVCLDASLMDAELLEVYAAPVIAELREHGDTTGTLCLDRLDEMPVDAQRRLSEWMETWPQRLRVIGTLHEDSPAESAPVPLGDVLVDAMAVFSIVFPKLSSRHDDLELIAAGMVRSARFSRDAMELIQSYPWPGEWDEFAAALQFAGEMVSGDRIAREHLPLAIRSFRPRSPGDGQVSMHESEITIAPLPRSARDFQIDSLDEALRQFESELIAQAMTAAGGNKAEAARRLGISRSRLLRKLAEELPS